MIHRLAVLITRLAPLVFLSYVLAGYVGHVEDEA